MLSTNFFVGGLCEILTAFSFVFLSLAWSSAAYGISSDGERGVLSFHNELDVIEKILTESELSEAERLEMLQQLGELGVMQAGEEAADHPTLDHVSNFL